MVFKTGLKRIKQDVSQHLLQYVESLQQNLSQRALRFLPSYKLLEQLFSNYQTNRLLEQDRAAFKKKIDGFLKLNDYKMEGFKDPQKQRDLSVKFHWGHNHDFGDFSLKGRMEDRHLEILATFMDIFKVLPKTLTGMKILDIGCWTGGTSLLLAAMGAHVVAIDEVKKYIECLGFLKENFKIDQLEPRHLSLFDCNSKKFKETFDFVLYAGVLSHVSDPILSLRIIFNSLKKGGLCLLESAAFNTKKSILTYKGPTVFRQGKKEHLDRGGWDWFIPSAKLIFNMMHDVGYSDIKLSKVRYGRVYAVATKKKDTDIMRGGLSVRNIV